MATRSVLRWEGDVVPTPRRVIHLAATLNVSVDVLVRGTTMASARMRTGLTQEDLAKLARVPRSTIQAAEVGRVQIPAAVRQVIEDRGEWFQ